MMRRDGARRTVWFACGLVSLCSLVTAYEIPRGWKVYTSRQGGFSARYPRGWNILPPPGAALDVVSFPLSRREVGSIIPSGGARIVLLKRSDTTSELENWIQINGSGNETTARTAIVLRRALSGEALRTDEVVSKWNDGTKQYENVDCYFELSGRLFFSRLTYWKDDSSAQQYRNVLHGIVESVLLMNQQR